MADASGLGEIMPAAFAPYGEDPSISDEVAEKDPEHEEKMNMMLDVLDTEGHFIMSKPRSVVHRQGFWHRALTLWVVDLKSKSVLIGQRPTSKDIDPGRWTCVTGRVRSGQLSISAALEQLEGETSIKMSDAVHGDVQLMFSIKCAREIENGIFAGQRDATWLDVYAAVLRDTIPIEQLKLDTKDKQAIRYIKISELKEAYERKDPEFVIPSNEEYTKKLFHYLESIVDTEHRCGRQVMQQL